MDYVGIDPAVGLECAVCKQISRMCYSELLELVRESEDVHCASCGRVMMHDWTTVSIVQNIIRKRMKEANDIKSKRHAAETA